MAGCEAGFDPFLDLIYLEYQKKHGRFRRCEQNPLDFLGPVPIIMTGILA